MGACHMEQQQLGRQGPRARGHMLHVPHGGPGEGLQHLPSLIGLQLCSIPTRHELSVCFGAQMNGIAGQPAVAMW